MIKNISDKYLKENLIVKTKVELIRNLDEFPFVIALNENTSKEVFVKIHSSITKMPLNNEMEFISSKDIKKLNEKLNIFMENNVINRELVSGLYTDNRSLIILVNFKDHLKFVSNIYGNKLDECFSIVDKLDDDFSKHLNYAFDEKYGYLTSSLMDVGTALRFNLVFHLPALSIIGYISKLRDALVQIGYNFNNLFEIEDSHYYILSNKYTLGVKESEFFKIFNDLTDEILNKEIAARETLINSRLMVLENDIKRAYGVLKHSILMSFEEAIKYISLVKLGISYGYFDDVDEKKMDEIIFTMNDGYFLNSNKKIISKNDMHYKRANYIKTIFGA